MVYTDILFFPSNDTIADWMIQIYDQFPNNSSFVVFPTRKENAHKPLEERQINFHSYYPGIIRDLDPAICAFGIDWGLEEIEAILESRLSGIPTVAIQEGVILNLRGNRLVDISDYGFVQDKYLNTDYFFCLGKEFLSSLNRKNLLITGNPKFDKYTKLPIPKQHKILINCNFPYGVDEEHRQTWIKEVVQACEGLNLDYFISKHPRDFGKIDVDESRIVYSSSSTIFVQIAKSSIVISRASTIIYEAIASGRKVIYHNPGIEALAIIDGFPPSTLKKSSTPKELLSSINDVIAAPEICNGDYAMFRQNHLGTIDSKSAVLCANGITDIINNRFVPQDSTKPRRKLNSLYDIYKWIEEALENNNKLIFEQRKWIDDLNQAKVYYLDNISQLEQNNSKLQEEIRGSKQKIRELNEARDWFKEKSIRIENDFSNY